MNEAKKTNDVVAETGRWLRGFAESCLDRSPLYHHLASGIVDDPALLPLAVSPLNQPPHIIFSAVHYLLLSGLKHPLAEYYPTVASHPAPANEAWPAFRSFCLENEDRLRSLIATRIVQTNEVARCSAFYLAIGALRERLEGRPLSLIEIGASAGLNLLFDRYAYDYDGLLVGDLASAVRIPCQLIGPHRPDPPALPPDVVFRRGIDLNPIDIDDDDAVLWLRSLIWPEQQSRVKILMHAIEIARRHRPQVIRGNALECLAETVMGVPGESALCVFHTYTTHTWSAADREALKELLRNLAGERDLYEISAEWLEGPMPKLEVTVWKSGNPDTTLLAHCDSHGRWVEWLDASVV